MAESGDSVAVTTPSVNVELTGEPDDIAATAAALMNPEPAIDEEQLRLNPDMNRAVSVMSVTDAQASVVEELMQPMDMDPFDEDQTELRFLHSKPTCFVVLGKPGSGKTTLARKLAQMWRCELVNSTDLILNHMETQTEVGKKAQEILNKGEALPEEMVAKMIEIKINSPEVAHHGYVLESFPSLSEDYMRVVDQLELVKNWKLKPDFIIHVRMPDKDLEIRRLGLRVDSTTNEMFSRDQWDPERPKPPKTQEGEGEEEEEGEDEAEEMIEEEGDNDFVELNFEVIDRLVKRPEDLPLQVEANIKEYKEKMLRILEDYMADHDNQYLIELDGNKSSKQLFKDLVAKLDTFSLRHAAVPVPLRSPEEDELPEEIETDELMRTLAGSELVAPRYRWRRSKWSRACPVELQKGNVVPGKPDYSFSFLDKIYIMSSEENVELFRKNPRPYLVGPQPKPPCKISVVGFSGSGKTTLSNLLAQKHNAKVLDMDELIKPRYEAYKKQQVDNARDEALKDAVITVRTRIKEREEMEAEMQEEELERSQSRGSELEETGGETEGERPHTATDTLTGKETDVSASKPEDAEGKKEEAPEEGEKAVEDDEKAPEGEEKKEGQDDEKKPEEDGKEDETVVDGAKDSEAEESKDDALVIADQEEGEDATKEDEPGEKAAAEAEVTGAEVTEASGPAAKQPVVVNEEHPEVKVLVDAAVKEAENQVYTLAPEIYVDVLEEALNDVHKELKKQDPNGARFGGWVLDNFPQNRDQWTVMLDRGLVVDNVICLKDSSEHGSFLQKRWYKMHREEINQKIRNRLEEEAREKQRLIDEASDLSRPGSTTGPPTTAPGLEEERQRAEEEARQKAEEEEERRRKLEEGGEEEAEDAAQEEEEEKPKGEEEPGETDAAKSGDGEIDRVSTAESAVESQAEEPVEDPMPPEGPELTQFKEQRMDFEREWSSISGIISGQLNIEPVNVEIVDRSIEDILQESALTIDQPYTYRPQEYTSMDIDEEEEDAEQDEEEEDEGEEEEDEEVIRNKKKQFGDTKHWCPVALTENNVLWPGNPDYAAKYRERIYYFSSQEARDTFMEDPLPFVAKDKPLKPPPIRLLFLGARGAGKSLHGRWLAKNLGLFHISFRDRLQELIIAKTKKKIGPEFEDELEEEEPDSDTEDGIVGPDGEKFDKKDDTSDTGTEKGGEEEGEEEQEIELTEDEEAIKANLAEDEALPEETLNSIVPDWWNKEPFKSTGFILEGFPRTADEAQWLATAGLFPNSALILNVEDTDITDRLLPPKLAKWKAKRDRRLAKKERGRLKKLKQREEAMKKRREELVAEADQRKAERMAKKAAKDSDADSEAGSDAEDEEEEEEENIDDILAEEFEEEEEEEDEEEEMEEDAVDRLKNEIGEMYDTDSNNLSSVVEILTESAITRIEVEAGKKPNIVRFLMERQIFPIINCRQSLFEKIFSVSEPLARRMLQIGYKHPSRFGRWCPVQLLEGECIQSNQGPGYASYPVIYRQYIYYLSSLQAKDKFIQNPLKYLKQTSPKPVVPIRMAVIGPPKSGKTTLANRFVAEFGMMRVSSGEAIRTVLTSQPKTELAAQLNNHLQKGLTVPDELLVQAVEVALMDMKCQTRGYILDGFPTNRKQIDLMTQRHIIPVRVVELEVESKELMLRGMKDRHSPDRTLPLHDSDQILAIRIASFQKEVGEVRQWYQTQHLNWLSLDAMRSKWWVWQQAVGEGRKSVQQIQTYLQKIADGKASSIANMCITPSEFKERLGEFGEYCPVSLALRGELVDCSAEPSLDHTAEFRGYYYKMASQQDLEAFLADPELYVPPKAARVLPPPDMLPRRRTAAEAKQMFPMQMELMGYCPVTYLDGKLRYEAIVPGNSELIVEYRGKLYCFESEEKLQKFMKLPENYYGLKLPHKLPPKKEPLPITSLPMLGYLEQSVSHAIIKAINEVGWVKPKYPFLSSTRSSLLYVAYHLKAYNPKSSEYVRKKYKKKLEKFEEQCQLITYLSKHMTVRYKEPNERPIDFDHKMDNFLNQEHTVPSNNWLM